MAGRFSHWMLDVGCWMFDVPSTRRSPRRRQGMALVVTLVLLAVITFLTITFLVLTRRETGSVATATDATVARLAADAAFERAKAEAIVPMIVRENPNYFDIFVSTNYFNRLGFTDGSQSPTNVNYEYTRNGNPLTDAQARQNLANRLYSPRAPVFVRTNDNPNTPLDDRFYNDLNRNGRFETNGLLPAINPDGGYYNTNGEMYSAPLQDGNTLSNHFVGDPEWIGVLERPEQPHSSSNRFISRYSFLVAPVGKTLDINFIHNYAKRRDFTMRGTAGDGFYRNQGVGTWEINLGAFLLDLNTNLYAWGGDVGGVYTYSTDYTQPNSGAPFQDALSLLRYRYGGDYRTLSNINGYLNPNHFATDNIDAYSDGPLAWPANVNENFDNAADRPELPWSGSDNTNHFFTIQDLFNARKVSGDFTNKLRTLGLSTSSYDRYTFYRLLAQLGTDTGGDRDKININYANAFAYMEDGVPTNLAFLPSLRTNFALADWSPTQFFTVAADRLLRTYTTNWFNEAPANYMYTFFNAGITNHDEDDLDSVRDVRRTFDLDGTPAFSITNIPVMVSNRFVYTPSVHRILQLAANIYDATTNATFGANPGYPTYPSVFRPIFQIRRHDNSTNRDLYITGYEEVGSIDLNTIPNVLLDIPVEAKDILDNQSLSDNAILRSNVYNVPWVIGARKGFPNFNEFAMQNQTTVARRLEFRRLQWATPTSDPYSDANRVAYTNQLYTIGISNSYGFEAWNSYPTNFQRPLTMSARNDITIILYETNALGQEVILRSNLYSVAVATNIPANAWKGAVERYGTIDPDLAKASFWIPFQTNVNLSETNFVYLQTTAGFDTIRDARSGSFEFVGNSFPVKRWWMRMNNRMRFFLLDTGSNPDRIVDYVQLSREDAPIDITGKMMDEINRGPVQQEHIAHSFDTNLNTGAGPNGLTRGILRQINISLGIVPVNDWNPGVPNDPGGGDVNTSSEFFKFNMGNATTPNQGQTLYKTNIFFAPFSPERIILQRVTWQANDPLVHYTIPDLFDPELNRVEMPRVVLPLTQLGAINDRYRPWAATDKGAGSDVPGDSNPANKDPLVYGSRHWDFPTNKLPGLGWLGRIHRGTPWQTIYMKSPDTDPTANYESWRKWSGNTNFTDASRTRPIRDRVLFDLFTVAMNDNASQGQLSVNQTNLAAWSAVLSGIWVTTNTLPDGDEPLGGSVPPTTNFLVQPAGFAGYHSAVGRIVRAINDVRQTNNIRGTNIVYLPLRTFQYMGDVLAVPELTLESPYLNRNADQRRYGISENAYERIPQQIMSLLRLGEPRFVVYSFGQALKPAPRSIITSGSFFGMCTNYQVTAETATRTVIRVENAPREGVREDGNPRFVVESFNILGPDE